MWCLLWLSSTYLFCIILGKCNIPALHTYYLYVLWCTIRVLLDTNTSTFSFWIQAHFKSNLDSKSWHIFGWICNKFYSRFPSLGIPRLELENLRWNTYVGHWNSYVGIPMSNVGIPTWVFQVQPRNSEARELTTK